MGDGRIRDRLTISSGAEEIQGNNKYDLHFQFEAEVVIQIFCTFAVTNLFVSFLLLVPAWCFAAPACFPSVCCDISSIRNAGLLVCAAVCSVYLQSRRAPLSYLALRIFPLQYVLISPFSKMLCTVIFCRLRRLFAGVRRELTCLDCCMKLLEAVIDMFEGNEVSVFRSFFFLLRLLNSLTLFFF